MVESVQNERWVIHVDRTLESAISIFLENRWQDLERFKIGIGESDYESLKKLSHKLLGTPGTFGYEYIVQLAREMEIAIEKKNIQALHEIADRYEVFMRNHEIVLK